MNTIYLDNAATTKPNQKAIEAALPYLTEQWQNPSSLSRQSRNIYDVIGQARKDIADYIGANSSEIYFTSGLLGYSRIYKLLVEVSL